MEIAIFDLDKTLTRRDTLLPWLRHAQSRGDFLRRLPFYLWQYLRYKTGRARAGESKEQIIRTVVGGLAAECGRELSVSFAAKLQTMLRPEGIKALKKHQSDGHCTVLLTASVDLAVSHWAEEVGFDRVIATRLEQKEGVYTGRFASPNCKGIEKVRRLDAEIPRWREAETYGYGDSPSDLPFLNLCKYAHYRTFD